MAENVAAADEPSFLMSAILCAVQHGPLLLYLALTCAAALYISEAGVRTFKKRLTEEQRECAAEPKEDDFKIFVGTWNVADRKHDVWGDWIDKDYDIYAIGSQENFFPSDDCESEWYTQIEQALGNTYARVAAVSTRNSIRLVVLCRRSLAPFITDIETSFMFTGLPVFIRKGAVGVCFDLHDVSLAFVCCHLSAHQGKVAARNNDVRQILRHLRLRNAAFDVTQQFDHIFFFGDMNYRIDAPLDELHPFSPSRLPALLRADQLHVQRGTEYEPSAALTPYEALRRHNGMLGLLHSMQEQPITFPPTYKLVKGSRDYDKTRKPAWCDRVLFRSLSPSNLTPMAYEAPADILGSDHGPVKATFLLHAPSVEGAPPACHHLVISDLKIKSPFVFQIGSTGAYASVCLRAMPSVGGHIPLMLQNGVLTSKRPLTLSVEDISPAWLHRQCMLLVVYDSNATSLPFTQLGQSHVMLGSALGNGTAAEPLYLESRMVGTIACSVSIQPKSSALPALPHRNPPHVCAPE